MLRITADNGVSQCIAPGAVGAGFLEGETYTFQAAGDVHTLWVDDVPLARQSDGTSFVWQPAFHAGVVRAEAQDAQGRLIGECSLDVGPSPDKLGKPLFDRMVNELLAYRPELLLGSEAARREFDHDGSMDNLEIAYARLRQYGEACASAFRSLCLHPVTHLRRDRRSVRPHQARKVDLTSIRELARSAAISMVGHADTDHKTPYLVTVPFSSHTLDNAANRAMAVMIDRLLVRIAQLEQKLQVLSKDTDHPLFLRMPRRRSMLNELHAAFKRIRRSAVFRAVTRAETTAAGLTALSAHPAYARAYQLAWKSMRSGIQGDSPADWLALSPTWEVYERWCFLQVTLLLARLLPDASWTSTSTGSAVDTLRVTGTVSDMRVEAYLQPCFRAWDQSGAFRSLSRQRVPDIVVTLSSPHGHRFIVLDAKYRASRPNVLDAMLSAHLYRDALIWKDMRPWKSLLLIPKAGGAPWLETAAFHASFAVGAVEIRDGDDLHGLETVLKQFLGPSQADGG